MQYKEGPISQDTGDGELIFIETCGFSMWPFLRDGERVIIKKAAITQVRIGDIIAYYSLDQKVVCHRLVKKAIQETKLLLYCRGDHATSSGAEVVTEERFIGRLAGVVRRDRVIEFKGVRWWFLGRVVAAFPQLIQRAIVLVKPVYLLVYKRKAKVRENA